MSGRHPRKNPSKNPSDKNFNFWDKLYNEAKNHTLKNYADGYGLKAADKEIKKNKGKLIAFVDWQNVFRSEIPSNLQKDNKLSSFSSHAINVWKDLIKLNENGQKIEIFVAVVSNVGNTGAHQDSRDKKMQYFHKLLVKNMTNKNQKVFVLDITKPTNFGKEYDDAVCMYLSIYYNQLGYGNIIYSNDQYEKKDSGSKCAFKQHKDTLPQTTFIIDDEYDKCEIKNIKYTIDSLLKNSYCNRRFIKQDPQRKDRKPSSTQYCSSDIKGVGDAIKCD